jgi:hypothetical protein
MRNRPDQPDLLSKAESRNLRLESRPLWAFADHQQSALRKHAHRGDHKIMRFSLDEMAD